MAEHHPEEAEPFAEILTLMQAPPEKRDTNRIAELAMPVAERLAKAKAGKYRGGKRSAQMDYDACLSAAMGGIEKFCKKTLRPEVAPDSSPDSLLHLCRKIISRALTDLEREVIGRVSHKPVPIPLDQSHRPGTTYKAVETEHFTARLADPAADEKSRAFDLADAKEGILKRLEKHLTPQQYRVLSAKMNHPEKKDGEIASDLEMERSVFFKHLTWGRERLRKLFPQFENEVTELLNGHSHKGDMTRF